jgi:hypothetical protein
MKMLTRLYVKSSIQIERFADKLAKRLKDERGALSLEWIGIGILAMAIIGITVNWLTKQGEGDETIGKAIIKKLADIIGGIGNDGSPDSGG